MFPFTLHMHLSKRGTFACRLQNPQASYDRDVVVSQNEGPQSRPQNTIGLITGTHQKDQRTCFAMFSEALCSTADWGREDAAHFL